MDQFSGSRPTQFARKKPCRNSLCDKALRVERKGVEPSTSALRTHEVPTELPVFHEVFVGVAIGRTAGRTELTSVIRLIVAAD